MSTEERLARIEENLNHIRHDVVQIKKSLPRLILDVELLKRDKRWLYMIVVAIAGLTGTAATILAEVFRR